MREAGGDDPAFYTEGNGRCYRDNKKLEEESGVIRLTCERTQGVPCGAVRVGEARAGTTAGSHGTVEGPSGWASLAQIRQLRHEHYCEVAAECGTKTSGGTPVSNASHCWSRCLKGKEIS